LLLEDKFKLYKYNYKIYILYTLLILNNLSAEQNVLI